MKKFLLVTFIGMVLVIDIYGIANEWIADHKNLEEEVDPLVTVVYME